MKRCHPFTSTMLVVAVASLAIAENNKSLPKDSQELLSKLGDYRLTEMQECRKKIDDAEKSGLAILAKHIERETMKGNLDAALLLKKIDSLTGLTKFDPQLPGESKALIKKFQAFEEEQRNGLQRRIEEKEKAVAQVLDGHMKKLSKQGDLEGAVALRDTIANLTGPDPATERPKTTSNFSPSGPTTRLDKIVEDYGAVKVTGTKAMLFREVILKDQKIWTSIPEQLDKRGALVCWPTENTGGVAEFEVTEAGYLLVVCDYGYQGNSGGGWTETRWTAKDFEDHGWREVSETLLGGPLIKGKDLKQTLFYKKLDSGETGKLRCNKYAPPYFVMFPN